MRGVLVSDTNIWHDVRLAGLAPAVFRLPATLAVTDLLFADELEEYEGGELCRLGLRVEPLEEKEIGLLEKLAEQYPGPGRTDLSCLALALSRGWILLTGDGALRKAAESQRCPVHGTLWLLDRMEECGLLPPGRSIYILEALRNRGRRLP